MMHCPLGTTIYDALTPNHNKMGDIIIFDLYHHTYVSGHKLEHLLGAQ